MRFPVLLFEGAGEMIASQKSEVGRNVGDAAHIPGIGQNRPNPLEPTALDVMDNATFRFEQAIKRPAGYADNVADRIDVQRAGVEASLDITFRVTQ